MSKIFFENDILCAKMLEDSQINQIAELFERDTWDDHEKIYRMFDGDGKLSQYQLLEWVYERVNKYKNMNLSAKDHHYTVWRKPDDKIIGWVTLYPMSDMQSMANELKMISEDSVVISYRIHPDERRKGYGAMIVDLFVNYIFKIFPEDNFIYMLIDQKNEPSMKLMKKLEYKELQSMRFYDGRNVSLFGIKKSCIEKIKK
jgi:RimJ/RimL family protein N-acetyltransferase